MISPTLRISLNWKTKKNRKQWKLFWIHDFSDIILCEKMSFLAMLLVTCLVSVFCQVESSEGVYVNNVCCTFNWLFSAVRNIDIDGENEAVHLRMDSLPENILMQMHSGASLPLKRIPKMLLGFNADFSKLPIPGCPASDEKSDVMIASRSRSVISRSKERRRLLMRKIWCQVEMWHGLKVFF